MTHCTVCGAEARAGAKFCTSCGARLVDSVSSAPASPDETATVAILSEETTSEATASDVPAETSDDQPDAETAWTSSLTSDATGATETAPVEGDEPAVSAETQPTEYASSWPASDDEPALEDAVLEVDDASAQPDSAWSSWSSATDETVTREAPESFAIDADQDPTPSQADASAWGEASASTPTEDRPSPFATDADQDIQSDESVDVEPAEVVTGESTAGQADEGTRDDHLGASEWESWAPVASGAATVPSSGDDIRGSVRRLLDDLANRIDHLIDPAPVERRGVDADELADQLDRWSSASTDAAGLLEVVQAVRKSPRDVDALTRLADRAPDLELLVRHYQAIANGAGDWSRKLRDQEASASEDA
jgi:hypothetical protein